MKRREQELEQLLEPTVKGLGYELWGLEYLSGGKRATLRIYIDTPDGVTVGDCERVSHQLNGVLDVDDPVRAVHTLEVSSPGLDRILFKPHQYTAHIGQEVDLRLRFPLDGRRKFVGLIDGVQGGDVVLRVDGTTCAVPLEQVHRARVVPAGISGGGI
ncbi:MAG: ribosome maturation factor RimP [Gammaproteobacteria bacterium]|nr:ribosome maturation factor RimP [Gammaproteobacteria bacterium]